MLRLLSPAMPALPRPGRAVEVSAATSAELSAPTWAEDNAASWAEVKLPNSAELRPAMVAVDKDAICLVVSVETVVTIISQLIRGIAQTAYLAAQQ